VLKHQRYSLTHNLPKSRLTDYREPLHYKTKKGTARVNWRCREASNLQLRS
jgi:hypothetical protein